MRQVYWCGYPIATLTTVRRSEEELRIKHCSCHAQQTLSHLNTESLQLWQRNCSEICNNVRGAGTPFWFRTFAVYMLVLCNPFSGRAIVTLWPKVKAQKLKYGVNTCNCKNCPCGLLTNKKCNSFCKLQSSTIKRNVAGTTDLCNGDWALEASERVTDDAPSPALLQEILGQPSTSKRTKPICIYACQHIEKY